MLYSFTFQESQTSEDEGSPIREIARKAGTVLDGTTCSGLQLRQVLFQLFLQFL